MLSAIYHKLLINSFKHLNLNKICRLEREMARFYKEGNQDEIEVTTFANLLHRLVFRHARTVSQ